MKGLNAQLCKNSTTSVPLTCKFLSMSLPNLSKSRLKSSSSGARGDTYSATALHYIFTSTAFPASPFTMIIGCTTALFNPFPFIITYLLVVVSTTVSQCCSYFTLMSLKSNFSASQSLHSMSIQFYVCICIVHTRKQTYL